MAVHASPGVYFEIIDLSIYAPQLSSTILALVGKTSKGSVEPTYCTTIRQFTDAFGTPRKGDYSALAAISFLEYGDSLWFRRILGTNAKSANVQIPKAVSVTNEAIGTADGTGKYIYKAELNSTPVPGTVEVKVTSASDADNYIVISDTDNGNGTGSFSPYTNSSITNSTNFIDYDTGEFRFTLTQEAFDALMATSTKTVTMKYNEKTYTATNEKAKTVVTVDTNKSYGGYLKYKNIVGDSTFTLKITTANDTVYLFTISGTPTGNVYTLVGKNGNTIVSSSVTNSNYINVATGEWKITFETNNLTVGDVVLASYTYTLFKTKVLGVIGADNGDGGKYGLSYIDSLNNVIYPNSVSVLVKEVASGETAETVVAKDNGSGKFITATGFSADPSVESCSNTVNYTSGALEIGFVTPPASGNKLTVSYMAKYAKTLYTNNGTTALSAPVTATATLDVIPTVAGSILIKVGEDGAHTFIDEDSGDGTGILVIDANADGKLAGNGEINYSTGVIDLTFNYGLTAGDTVVVDYLSVFANITAKNPGDYYNDLKVEFYKDQFYGYGLKVWTPDQYTSQTPEEDFKNITFDDSSKTTYITNKVISSYINIELLDEAGSILPVFSNIYKTTGGDDDADHITESTAMTALEDFSNYETYDINLIACPDYPGDKNVIAKLINICEVQRGDCFAIVDTPQNLTPQNAVNWHNGDGLWSNENSVNSSFCALYYPWMQILDTFTESLQWVPPSVKLVSVYAYNDSVAEVWNAPAGLNRGKINSVQQLERQLTIGERDLLYATSTNCINPICDFVSDGIVVYGQKTTQRKPSALDRVNVMRLVIYITKVLATSVKYLLFEPGDETTWIQYKNLVQPYLEEIKTRRGLYEFKIVCDSSTNTSYMIDNNTMVAEIWMKPTKTAERIITRFMITSTGASFDELASD